MNKSIESFKCFALVFVSALLLFCGASAEGEEVLIYEYYDPSGNIYTKETTESAEDEDGWIVGCLKRRIKRFYQDAAVEYDPVADRHYGRIYRRDIVEDGYRGAGSYLMFDPNADTYVDCGSDPSLNLGNDFTLVARAKIAPGGGGYLISKRDGDRSQYGMAVSKDTGGLLFVYGDGSQAKVVDLNFSFDDWRDGEWHEFAITVKQAFPPSSIWVTGYVDGVAYRQRNTRYGGLRGFWRRRRSYNGITTFSDVPVLLGARGDGDGGYDYILDGAMTDAKLFDVPLTQTEISDLFAGNTVSGIVSHWDMSEGEDDTINDTIGANNGAIRSVEWGQTDYYEEYVYYDESDPTDARVLSMSVKDLGSGAYLGGYDQEFDAEGNLSERREYDRHGEVVRLAKYNVSGTLVEERIARKRDVESPRQEEFISVANLAWSNYGYDLGMAVTPGEFGQRLGYASNPGTLRSKLEKWTGHGYVRLFLFCDFRAGMEFSDGTNTYQDEFGEPIPEGTPIGFFGTDVEGEYTTTVYNDMAELLSAAEELDLKLIPTLFDYRIADGAEDAWQQEHRDLVEDGDKRQALIDIFRPFIREFGDHESIYAWDVMNEPEMACEGRYEGDPYDPVSLEGELGMKEFVKRFIKMIHEETESALVTVGSFEKGDMMRNWVTPDPSDPERDVDVLQFHYYDNMKQYHLDDYERLDHHIKDLDDYMSLQGKPVIAGELDPVEVGYKLDVLANNGYDGGLFWDDVDNPIWTIDEEELETINEWFYGTLKTYYDSGRIQTILTPCPDGAGSIYMHYTDEDYAGTGQGLLEEEILARYDANGARCYRYEYYTGTSQVHYKYAYHTGEYTNIAYPEFNTPVFSEEYSTDGSLMNIDYDCTRYTDTGYQRAEFFDGPGYDGWNNDYKYYLNEQWNWDHGREYIERNVSDNKVYKYAYREGTYDRIEKWEYGSVDVSDPNIPVLGDFQVAWFWYDNENMRYKGKLLAAADGEGNIYYERYDENWNEWGHGRIYVTQLAEANGNGELSFEYVYHDGSEQEQYVDSYRDEARTVHYGTYEYSLTGELLGFTPGDGYDPIPEGFAAEVFSRQAVEDQNKSDFTGYSPEGDSDPLIGDGSEI